MNWKTHDLINDNLQALKQLFPEAFSEDKIDFEKLQLLLWKDIVNDKEKYSFSWKGKNDAIKLALAQNTWTLRPDKESSKNWDTTQNLYIEWDNLEVLRTLQDSYRWKVKMIYIDPPYNTWKDFVYKDNFTDNVASYKEKMNENMKSNPETNGRYHTDWLNMMYPRLKLARNLLKDDWVIFISIDENEYENLRKICDEIYWEENFIWTIIWKNKFWSWAQTKWLIWVHEYILIFSKNSIINITRTLTNDEKINYNKTKDDKFETRWGYVTQPLSVKTFDDRPTLVYPISYNWTIIMPDKQWVWSKDRMMNAIENNEVVFNLQKDWTYNIRSKKYLIDENWNERKWKPTSFFDKVYTQNGTKEINDLFKHKIFDFNKPIDLIKYLVWFEINDYNNKNDNDIILDFFSWSWTTAHAVMKLNSEDWGNRKFICVQIPELTDEKSEAYKAWYKNICEIWKERIRRAGEKILEENKDKEWIENLDIWFKVFKLDSTNLKKWETSVEWETEDEIKKELQFRLTDLIEPVKEDREQIDMIYEIMLKNGMDLTLPMEEMEIKGKKVFSISLGYLIACLEKNVTLEIIKEIINLKPKVVVFYDNSFADDIVKVNAREQLEKLDIQVRVI